MMRPYYLIVFVSLIFFLLTGCSSFVYTWQYVPKEKSKWTRHHTSSWCEGNCFTEIKYDSFSEQLIDSAAKDTLHVTVLCMHDFYRDLTIGPPFLPIIPSPFIFVNPVYDTIFSVNIFIDGKDDVSFFSNASVQFYLDDTLCLQPKLKALDGSYNNNFIHARYEFIRKDKKVRVVRIKFPDSYGIRTQNIVFKKRIRFMYYKSAFT